jgi:hypothetical protein
MLNLVAIAIVVLAAAILIYVATKPDIFHVERSINIKAPLKKYSPFSTTFSFGMHGRHTTKTLR